MKNSNEARWRKVKALFKAALALPSESRLSFLRGECGDDTALMNEVTALLHSESSDQDIAAIVRDAAQDTVAAQAIANVDQRVGNYKLIELVGSGGMGNVYLAERVDDRFDHRVAIKLLHAHHKDQSLIERFQVERQTLANLDHANIARLLDGGETDDGIPYLVMEYVDGIPVDKYCDENLLSVPQRLQLFKKICIAVDYAHRNLVVHRDIKPSNILVSQSGEPKLLDFGIAKFIDSMAANYTIAPTRQGQAAMTPEFASPEQVRGETITTATDVYSLGVLLYILLSGRRPYLEHSTNMAAIAKAICDTEPSRPSTVISLGDEQDEVVPQIVASRRTSVGKLIKLLTGDLDNIVMMTLQKEPERRYSSARALADDIDNYMADEPVLARPDSLFYRAGKFTQRNRWGVATAALILSLVVGLPSYYSVLVAEQRDLAQLEADKAARVSEFMLSLFETSDPEQAQGEAITARSLLDQGALRIDHELSVQPAVRAAMQDVMGGAYRGLGLYEQSRVLLQEAMRTRVELFGTEHADVLQTATKIASLSTSTGDFEESEALHREALALSQKIYGADSLTAAMLLTGLANAIYEQGRHDEARAEYAAAIDMHARLSPDESYAKAVTLHGYGWLLTNMGEFEEAEALLRSSVAMLKATVGEFHPEVPAAMNHLTYALMDSGQWDAAETIMREGMTLSIKIYGEEHPSVSADLFTLGTILQRKGQYAEAEALYRQGLAADIKMLGEDHPYIATDKNNLAGALKDQGKYQEAENLYRESIELNQQLFGLEHPETATSMSNAGLTRLQLGNFDGAKELFEEALRIRMKVLGEEHPATLSSQNIYAIYYFLVEDYEASRTLFETTLEKRIQVLGESHSSTINTMLGLSETLREMNFLDEAASALQPGYELAKRTLGETHPISVKATYVRATILEKSGDTDAAGDLYRDALTRYREVLTPQHPRLATVLIALGDLLTREGQADAALPLLEEAVLIRQKILPAGHWEIAVAQSVLGSCQSALGLPEADAMLLQTRHTLINTRGADNHQTELASARLAAHRAK